jgi:hypothetical protein
MCQMSHPSRGQPRSVDSPPRAPLQPAELEARSKAATAKLAEAGLDLGRSGRALTVDTEHGRPRGAMQLGADDLATWGVREPVTLYLDARSQPDESGNEEIPTTAVYATTGNREVAIASLGSWKKARADSDLAALRKDARFAKVLAAPPARAPSPK